MQRYGVIGYAVLAYVSFVAATVWAVVFTAGAIDRGAPHPAAVALPVDVGLLLLFAVQHSVMARDRVKRVLPVIGERSTYVLASSLVLGLLFWQWQALPGTVWRIDAQPWTAMIWAAYAIGWLIAVASTFMIDHLDFLGLRQAVSRRGYEPPTFRERWLYAWVRHPMMAGLLIAFWATPRMTYGHLVFTLAGSAYILVGLRFEERDLRRHLGDVYGSYAERVPSLVPVRRPVQGQSGGRAA